MTPFACLLWLWPWPLAGGPDVSPADAPPAAAVADPGPYVHRDFWAFPGEDLAGEVVAFEGRRLAYLRAWRATLTWGRNGEPLSGEQLWYDAAIADAEARRDPWHALLTARRAARAPLSAFLGEDDPGCGPSDYALAASLRDSYVDGWMAALRDDIGDDCYRLGVMPQPVGRQFALREP